MSFMKSLYRNKNSLFLTSSSSSSLSSLSSLSLSSLSLSLSLSSSSSSSSKRLLSSNHINNIYGRRKIKITTTLNQRYFGIFNRESISKSVIHAEYAVRGPIVVRANQIELDLKNKKNSYPFDKLIMCNIGNPQDLGQIPLTFHRQVLSGLLNPALLDMNVFPKDVKERASKLLNQTPCHTIGAYTHSQGYRHVRESVSEFITKRDNTPDTPSDADHIFLTDGASPGIKYILQCLISEPSHGVLLPIPQYPLYSATVALLNGTQIGYYLNESKGWDFEIKSASDALTKAKKNGVVPRALVVINPGNPTGQCIDEDGIRQAIELAKKEKLIILADEVYQENVYDKTQQPFVSFRKVLLSMGDKYKDVELVSFHSISKGVFGECGLRGGYMELMNVDSSGFDQLYKLASINLCPNTVGQLTVDLMCKPPTEGDESYKSYKKEYNNQYDSLKRRATILSEALNKIEGIKCQPIKGAMYAFPTITLPKKAIEKAKSKGQAPDAFYCLNLLEKAGICVVPGSGFGQVDGTWHFRTTLLPPENEIQQVVTRLGDFHKKFTKEYQ